MKPRAGIGRQGHSALLQLHYIVCQRFPGIIVPAVHGGNKNSPELLGHPVAPAINQPSTGIDVLNFLCL